MSHYRENGIGNMPGSDDREPHEIIEAFAKDNEDVRNRLANALHQLGQVSAQLGAMQQRASQCITLQQDPDGSKELADDEAIQRVLDESWAAKGCPHTSWGLRAMLASIGLIIVKSPDGATKR